jgi:diacylglycerol kinase (ATP)
VPDSGPQRWFGAVLGAGFDAIVNERANRMRFPRGPRRYDIAIVAELVRLRPRHYRITLDGEVHDLDAVLVAIGNTPSYGGGMRICPAADATDGLLDLVVVGPIGRATFTRIKPRVYAGTHVDHPAVTSYRAATIRVEAEGITAYVDGERTSPLPVTVHAAPGALQLLA